MSRFSKLNNNLINKLNSKSKTYDMSSSGWYRCGDFSEYYPVLITIDQIYGNDGGATAVYLFVPNIPGCVKIASGKRNNNQFTKFRTMSSSGGKKLIDFHYLGNSSNPVNVSLIPLINHIVDINLYDTPVHTADDGGDVYEI